MFQAKPFRGVALLTALLTVTLGSCTQSEAEPIDFSAFPTPESKALALSDQFPGLSVTVMRGDEILWDWSHGYADIETQEPVTTDTRFNIYSVSKMITGMAFAKLHEDEVLPISTQVRGVLPNLPTHYNDIKIEHLLSHRSGIRHYQRGKDWSRFSELRCANTEDAVNYFVEDSVEFTPGTDQLYSTFGMVLASHVLVEATGAESFADAINGQLDLVDPIQLDSETIKKATPYKVSQKGFERIDSINAECKFAGGGLVASTQQLAQIGANFMNGYVLPADRVIPILIDEKPDGERFRFAMQTGHSDRLGSHYASMRGGATGGRGMLVILPDAQLSIAIAANAEGEGSDVSGLALSLAEDFLKTD